MAIDRELLRELTINNPVPFEALIEAGYGFSTKGRHWWPPKGVARTEDTMAIAHLSASEHYYHHNEAGKRKAAELLGVDVSERELSDAGYWWFRCDGHYKCGHSATAATKAWAVDAADYEAAIAACRKHCRESKTDKAHEDESWERYVTPITIDCLRENQIAWGPWHPAPSATANRPVRITLLEGGEA